MVMCWRTSEAMNRTGSRADTGADSQSENSKILVISMCMVKDMGIDTLGHKTWGQGWENKGNAYAHGTDRQTDIVPRSYD